MTDGFKRCSKCGETKARSAFYRDSSRKDGRCPYCKTCQAAYCRNNKGLRAGYSAVYRQNNKDKAAAYFKAYYEINRDKKVSYNKDYRRNNKDKTAAYYKDYRKNNPDKIAKIQKRRAERETNAPGGPYVPTRLDYKPRIAFFACQCAYCLVAPAMTLDHAIPLSRGGSNWPANIYPVCFPCNREKSAKILYKEYTPRRLRKAA